MSDASDLDAINELATRARKAQAAFEDGATQERYDRAALAAGWAIMQPERNRKLAKIAVETTGLGNVADKITKNHRKTLGLLRDIRHVKSCGIIKDNAETGLIEIARPIGLIGAVVPSTNPGATPANNIINALKCGNAIIVSPSPKGVETCALLLHYVHEQFEKIGVDPDLVQMISPPGSKDKTQRLLEIADLIIVTGSQNNVKRAYTSGTPAIAVGAGNVTVIVDETADLGDAASKIAASKCFDNATSCSSENSLIVVDAVYDRFIAAMQETGGALVRDEAWITSRLWKNGHLSVDVVAKDADRVIDALELSGRVPSGTEYIAVETSGIGDDHPLSAEKLSRVLALYRAQDFAEAREIARRLLNHQGAGHSIGIHSKVADRPIQLGKSLPTCRVIVNQAHTFATGGGFNNGMPFSLSMGCGSWAGNSIDTNLHWRHFMQTTKIVRTIQTDEPTMGEIFDDYWAVAGK